MLEIVWRNMNGKASGRVVVDRTMRRDPETGETSTVYRTRTVPQGASVEYEIVVGSRKPVTAA
jgi:hypothetical protein